jgi:peptidoglycan/xylan/chitin deacetylase (PgdA/CDA1 family)
MNQVIFFLVRWTGIFYLLKRTIMKRNVSIVCYHDPAPDVFKKHIEFLNNHYAFISLENLVSGIRNKDWSKIPNNSLVITFDDGHKGNYKLLETIKKYQIKPLIFCVSDIVCTNRHFWWKDITHQNVKLIREFKNQERLTCLKDKFNYYQDKEFIDRQALSSSEILELSKIAIFGSHTQFHPILTCCTNEELKRELLISKKNIESITNNECHHFCYPNGDYNENIIKEVKLSGYKSARTIDVGWNNINSDPFKLKITGITDNASKIQLIAQLTGITMFLRYMFKGGSFSGLYKSIIPRNK